MTGERYINVFTLSNTKLVKRDHRHVVHPVQNEEGRNLFCDNTNQAANCHMQGTNRTQMRAKYLGGAGRTSCRRTGPLRDNTANLSGTGHQCCRTAFGNRQQCASFILMTTSARPDDRVYSAAGPKLSDVRMRRWAKTDATQQRILDAATDVFAARGFTAATMADIVDHSGASIGSIYHHFGGKREVFLAIFERLAANVSSRIDSAPVRPAQLGRQRALEASARVFLDAIWANRRAAMVLTSGDTPAGFDSVLRASMLKGFRRWTSVLELDASPRGQLLTRILVAVLAEASTMVIMCDNADEVGPITDATAECIARLAS